MRIHFLISGALVSLLCGCATPARLADADKKKGWGDAIVVESNICASDGSARLAKDESNRTMYCAFEEILGTHMRRCICHDEAQSKIDKDDAQQYMRNAAQTKQIVKGQ